MKALILNDTRREEGHLGCFLVMNNLLRLCDQYGLQVLSSERNASERFDITTFRDKVKQADVVIINGEGTLHHNRGLGLFRQAEIAHEEGKPVYLINAVWQGNSDTAQYLPLFEHVFVRESRSLDEVRQTGYDRVDVIPDLLFYTDIPSYIASCRKNQGAPTHYAIIDSVLPEISVKLGYWALISGAPYLFMGQHHRNKFRHDHRLMAWLLSLRNRSSLSMVQSVKQMFPYQAVVTGRFHMACIAMLLNQPFVAIASNTHKLEGMLDDAGIDASAYLIPQDDASLSMINHRVLQMVSQTHADMQEQSQAYVAHARSRIELMLQQIARPRMTRIQPLIHAV